MLETLHLFFEIIDLFVDDVQGRQVVMPVLDFDLNQKLVVFALFCEILSLIKCLKLLSAHFNSSVNIENGIPLSLILRLLNEVGDLVLLLHLDIAV